MNQSPETRIVAILNELLQFSGPEHGITNSSYDGDNDSASVAFDFEGTTYLISSSNIQTILP